MSLLAFLLLECDIMADKKLCYCRDSARRRALCR